MVDMPNASNNGSGGDDDNDNGGANGNNSHYRDSPSCDGSLDEDGNPQSEFSPFDEDILNESLGSSCHDECRERLIRMAKKVNRDNKRLLQRM